MAIKVLINGAFGKMGQVTVKAITNHSRLELVAQTSRESDLKKMIHDSRAQVVIDFTHPSVVFANAQTIINAGAHPVIGTTGLQLNELAILKQRCAELKLGGIIAPNFSLGAVLLMKYAQAIARYIPNVEIIEMHHPEKADSPSGTALYAAQMIEQVIPAARKSTKKPQHETLKGARGADYKGIAIHALRLPGMLANLQITFGSQGETLTLRHDTIDRQCFMAGVCIACEKVVDLNELIYGLEQIL